MIVAISFKENFSGYCQFCDKKVLDNAEFCHHCGHCLVSNSSDNKTLPILSINNPDFLKSALNETNNLFLIWCCCISFLGASGLIYFSYHSLSALVVSVVAFIYVWIFLTSKLDDLALKIQYRPRQIAFLSLLIPILGTLFCYQKLSTVVTDTIQANKNAS